MYDPNNNVMVPLSPELREKFANPDAVLTETEKVQRNWAQFHEGERISIKGVLFYVHEIGESRMVLKFVTAANRLKPDTVAA
jgi:hypothetical protein